MKNFVVSLLLLAFCILLVQMGSLRLYDWYETGQLLVHRKPIFGPDQVSYNSNPFLFVSELSWNLFLVGMGFLGIGSACQEFVRYPLNIVLTLLAFALALLAR